ncbi:oxidoreductase [Longispora sp. NPDC051575]|uniref:WD40/YVTN/BNR-like repeat-containing protein n=1 Tax=Longispora sp. NPDC051575 TaxID=3154943 RepID=UPI0034401BCC
MMKKIVVTAAVAALIPLSGTAAQAAPHRTYAWELNSTPTTSRLRGLAAVNSHIAWTSGSGGRILRTTDAGHNWASVGPAGVETLQFRDIEAFDARNAVALSIGPGTDSRIYVTADAGRTWTKSFQNTDENAFYDCAAFGDRQHGLVMSDPVDGKFRFQSTSDGGRTWSLVDPAGMPAALPGEAAFAASGTCLVARGQDYWLATGGGAFARVFHSSDHGRNWTVANTPVRSLESGGIFSLAFRTATEGIAIGGDFAAPDRAGQLLAVTHDGGATWTEVADTAPKGYRSGAVWTGSEYIAVGPTGSDYSVDGITWKQFDAGSFDAVSVADGKYVWASGEQGRAARLVIRH